jgi:Holliday junction resolvase-like predicted endonuclease
MNTARQRSEKNGRRAEILTIFLNRLMGWRLIKKRARAPFGEIDIIMHKYQRLKFIEVKYRRRKSYKE